MDKKKKPDGLERLFSSKLNNIPNEGDWNLPSRDILSPVLTQLETDRKKRKNRWFLLLLLFIFILMGSIVIVSYIRINSLQSQLQKYTKGNIQQHTQTLSPAMDENIAVPIEKNNIVKKGVTLPQNSSSKRIENTILPIIANSSTTYSKSKLNNTKEVISYSNFKTKSTTEKDKVDKIVSSKKVNKPTFLEPPSKIIPKVQKQDNLIDASSNIISKNTRNFNVDYIPSMPIELNDNIDHPFIPSPKAKTPKSIKYPSSFGINTTYHRNALDMKDVGEQDFQLIGYDKYTSGIALGIHYQKYFTKVFNIKIAADWNKFYNKSQYISTLKYDKNNESLNGHGETVYRHSMQVATPMGNMQTDDFVVVNQNIDLEHEEEINNITNIKQVFSSLSIATQFQYDFIRTKKTNIYAGIGVRYNRILKVRNTFDTILEQNTHGTQIAHYYNNIEGLELDLEKDFWNSIITLGANYQLNQHWDIGISGEWGRAISSMKKTNANDNARTLLQRQAISLGLQYRF